MAEEKTVNNVPETTETAEKEGVPRRIFNWLKGHAKGFFAVGAGVGIGALLACLAGSSDNTSSGYEYPEEGEVEEGGSEE